MTKPPEFIINPVANYSTVWMPEPFQLSVSKHNPRYVNSVWLGTVWNVMSLPLRVFTGVVVPLFHFRVVLALANLFVIPAAAFVLFFAGLLGDLLALPLTKEQASKGLVLDREQGMQALALGNLEFVTHIDNIRL